MIGTYLVGKDGRTLYSYKPDEATPGKSTCNGACATSWPPLEGTAKAGSGVTASKISSVTRDNGTKQVAYSGHPLYYFSGDSKSGETNGQGIGGIWFVVKP
jgi:predicted lipoprotein with Yx(FWY)xxD motif